MQNNKIINLQNPQNTKDAANKDYVDVKKTESLAYTD